MEIERMTTSIPAGLWLPEYRRKIYGRGCETFVLRREGDNWKVLRAHRSPRSGEGD